MLTFIELIWILAVNFIALGAFGFIAWIVLTRQINTTIGAVIDNFVEIFADPNVKRAMTIMGKESGKVRAEKATTEAIAKQVLDNPNIQGWKMIAKTALGIDLDEMIGEYGAVETLAALKQIGETMGINIPELITQGTKGLNTTTESSNTTGSYLRG
jgi:hypothetical protein